VSRRHVIKVLVGGVEIRDWESYEIRLSLREPVSTAALSGAFQADRFAALPLGAEVQITIDGRPVFAGYMTQRTRQGHRLDISCHDRVWRLVQDAAPLRRIRRDTISSLAEVLAEGVFAGVVFQNARNRALYGTGARRTGGEPPVFDRSSDPVKTPPGSSRWAMLAEVLLRAELLGWSSGDGQALVLAKPNFAQEARYEFVLSDQGRGTCTSIQITESIEQSYRQVIVVGQSRTSSGRFSYGIDLQRQGTATDPSYPLPITRRIVEQCYSIEDATYLAQAHLDDAKSDAVEYSIEAEQHGQGGRLYVPDTVARIRDERCGFDELGYVTAVSYRGSRTEESASIQCVPLHTRIVVQ
jgi:prophage tail gpP-like protein